MKNRAFYTLTSLRFKRQRETVNAIIRSFRRLLCRRLRISSPALGIVVLADDDDVKEKIAALWAGADDYFVKMPDFAELRARIDTLIRRTSTLPAMSKILFGPIELDPIECRVTVYGSPVELTLTQFRILSYMLSNPGRPIRPEEFKKSIFLSNESGDNSKLRFHIYKLRLRLGKAGRLIFFVPRQGYRIDADEISHRDGYQLANTL